MKHFIISGLFLSLLFLNSCDQLNKFQTLLKSQKETPVKKEPEQVQKEQPEVKTPGQISEEAKTDSTIQNEKQSNILAVVNGIEITREEVRERVKSRLRKLESQIFEIEYAGLNGLIDEKLLESEAKKRDISVDDLLKAEVSSHVTEPTEKEIETYYSLAKKNFQDQPLDKVRPILIRQIKANYERAAFNKFIENLHTTAAIEILVDRPRVEVSLDDDPHQGVEVADAQIILLEFSDFQCPFCKRTRPTIDKIMEDYKGKVRYVFRDFPLSFHKDAQKAHQASNCAGEQNKYWEYNRKLWDNQRELKETSLKTYATELGLNIDEFNTCLDSNKYEAEINKDIKEGADYGVSGTPAYFVNGVFISGAQPFEKFKEVIDSELRRK